MRRTLLWIVAVLASWPAPPAVAAEVDALQPPAWVARAGQRQPLRPGMALAAGDTVETGKDGRLLVRLADGSLLRFGGEAQWRLVTLDGPGAPGPVIEAGHGALRYSAGGRAPAHGVRLTLGSIGIDGRGADLWVRVLNGTVTACLFEGEAAVRHPVGGEFTIDRAPAFFVAPPEGEPHPVAPPDAGQLAAWSAETELQLGQGVMLPGGGWIVQLGSYEREADARRLAGQLLDAGLPVEVTSVQLRDRSFYRLRIAGFDSRQDARAFAARTRPRPGMPDPWVTCEIPGRSCE